MLTLSSINTFHRTYIWDHEDEKKDNSDDIVEPGEETVGDAFRDWVRRFADEFVVERRTAFNPDVHQYEARVENC